MDATVVIDAKYSETAQTWLSGFQEKVVVGRVNRRMLIRIVRFRSSTLKRFASTWAPFQGRPALLRSAGVLHACS